MTMKLTVHNDGPVEVTDYSMSVTLTWLDVRGGLAVALVRIATPFMGARSYSAKMLIGRDGHEMLEANLIDSVSFGPDGAHANKLHPFTEADVIEAARKTWQEQRAATMHPDDQYP